MTGEQLFNKARESGAIAYPLRKDWSATPERTKTLYNFLASCPGPLTGEQLFSKIIQEGLLTNDWPWNERSASFQRIYNYFASQL